MNEINLRGRRVSQPGAQLARVDPKRTNLVNPKNYISIGAMNKTITENQLGSYNNSKMTLAAMGPPPPEHGSVHHETMNSKNSRDKMTDKLREELKRSGLSNRRNFNMTTNSFVVQPTFTTTRNDGMLGQGDTLMMTSGTFDADQHFLAQKRSGK